LGKYKSHDFNQVIFIIEVTAVECAAYQSDKEKTIQNIMKGKKLSLVSLTLPSRAVGSARGSGLS
jgi:hypothetical protein